MMPVVSADGVQIETRPIHSGTIRRRLARMVLDGGAHCFETPFAAASLL